MQASPKPTLVPLMEDAEILDEFAMLHATIGLSASRFGYITCGNPGILKAIQRGRKVHDKTRRQITDMLRYIEAGHAEPLTPELKAKLDALGVSFPAHPDAPVDDMES